MSAALTLGFQKLAKQTEAGLYCVKRIGTYIRKLTEAEESFVKELTKATKYEENKRKQMQV
jgi:hypothetical protein